MQRTPPRGLNTKSIMAKINENTENATIANGVVLTASTSAVLLDMQDHDNEMLIFMNQTLADAICFLASNIEELDHEECHNRMRELAFIRNKINKLRKP